MSGSQNGGERHRWFRGEGRRRVTAMVLGAVLAMAGTAAAERRDFAADAPVAAEPAAPRLRLALTYSASGTHSCKTASGAAHSCVVTGPLFGNCIEASSSLQAQDCCPSSRLCSRDAQRRETDCQPGGTSVGFTLNYCIPGR